MNTIGKVIQCPVCGKTMVEEYEICSVCKWENDHLQLMHLELRGANRMTIGEAREAYKNGKQVE